MWFWCARVVASAALHHFREWAKAPVWACNEACKESQKNRPKMLDLLWKLLNRTRQTGFLVYLFFFFLVDDFLLIFPHRNGFKTMKSTRYINISFHSTIFNGFIPTSRAPHTMGLQSDPRKAKEASSQRWNRAVPYTRVGIETIVYGSCTYTAHVEIAHEAFAIACSKQSAASTPKKKKHRLLFSYLFPRRAKGSPALEAYF